MVAGLPPPQANQITQEVASDVTKVQEVGGLVGRLLLAFLVVRIVSRQKLIRMFQIPGLIVMPLTFIWLRRQPELELAAAGACSLRAY